MLGVEYIWPELSYQSLKIFFVTFFTGFIIFILFGLYTNFYKRQERAWNDLLNFAYSHQLNTGEIKILRKFFKQLGFSYLQNFQLIQNPALFKEKFQEFLETQHPENPEQYVQVVDKLFPPEKALGQITSIYDIQIGEYCSVNFASGVYLGQVIKKSGDYLTIRIFDWKPEEASRKEEIILYFYRIDLGGFLLSGMVEKSKPGSILFLHDGTIEMRGDEHLMAEIRRPAILKPNDVYFDTRSMQAISFDEEGNPTNASDTLEISCIIEYLSDQGALLQIRDLYDPSLLRRYDEWNIQIGLDTEQIVEAEGILMPSKTYGGKYLFKFTTIAGNYRKAIFAEVLKHKPTKARLS